jgi:hypothetical protein
LEPAPRTSDLSFNLLAANGAAAISRSREQKFKNRGFVDEEEKLSSDME